MTGIYEYLPILFAAQENAFGKTGILDKYGNILGIVLCVFGLIMLAFSGKVKKMGSFYLEMTNKEPVIKETNYVPAEAEIVSRRTTKLATMTLKEMLVQFDVDGITYSNWTPDLGFEGNVAIEYDPVNPKDFYISDKVKSDENDTPDTDDNGEVLTETPKTNNAFIAMLGFGIVLFGLGAAFLYDFYFIK